MRLLAPAKINLHLRVGPRRASDGFHPLLSWMVTVGLFDNLELDPTDRPGISLSTNRDDLPTDQGNLVVKAARAAAGLATRGSSPGPAAQSRGVHARLLKQIPVGSGLGGGSSDAATTLRGLNRLWRLDCPADKLIHLAATLGSDVPFFLRGPSSVCSGRGEVVKPIAPPCPKIALLVLTGIPIPTADVYRKFDALSLGREQDVTTEPDWQVWTRLNAAELLPRLVNDLEPAAFALRPDLSKLRDDAEQTLGRVVRMSGSGGTLFSLYDDPHNAATAAERLTRVHAVQVVTAPIAPVVSDDLTT